MNFGASKSVRKLNGLIGRSSVGREGDAAPVSLPGALGAG